MKKYILVAIGLSLAACSQKPIDAETLINELENYVGKRVTVKAKFRSGARCRLETPDGEWKSYCKDCQYCRGPVVMDTPSMPTTGEIDDWPIILGGTWQMQDIRCKGKLNEVECYPFEPGKTYVVFGRIENQRPRKLLVRDFWEADD